MVESNGNSPAPLLIVFEIPAANASSSRSIKLASVVPLNCSASPDCPLLPVNITSGPTMTKRPFSGTPSATAEPSYTWPPKMLSSRSNAA